MLELIPLILFFISFKLYGIYTATWILIASTSLMMLKQMILHKKLSKAEQLILASVWIFGLATVCFDNPVYLMWKPSFIFSLLSLALVYNEWSSQKTSNIIQTLLEKSMTMNYAGWQWMQRSWATFFALEALINAMVAVHCSLETWVHVKVIGLTLATLLFIIFQMTVVIRKYECKLMN